jgi:predicted ATPase
MLGGFHAVSGGHRIDRFSSQKTLLLFARLLLEPRTVHSREELVEWLWRGVASRAARRSLATAVWELSKKLDLPGQPPGTEVLIKRTGTLQINPARLSFDVAAFEAAVLAGDAAAARRHYAGGLLPGLEDEWIEQQRRRLTLLLDDLGDGLDDSESERRPLAATRVRVLSGTSAAAPVNLLGYVDGFFGRQQELRQIAQALETHRLLSLLGGPGVGKTRLANELASTLGGFDSACFVALRSCADAAELVEHVADVLAPPSGESTALERVRRVLEGRRAIVVLDNLEHLVGEVLRGVIGSLLACLPRLHLLVTSRRALDVPGEHCIVIQGLPVPPDGAKDAAALSANAAVSLFVARARAARADFGLHAKNAAGIAALCRRFAGVPLAIEIAATRARFVRGDFAGLAESAAILDFRKDHRARRGERATLADAIGASWTLLGTAARWMLVCVASFKGDCTFEAAVAVSGLPAGPGADAVDELLAHGLVAAVAMDGRRGAARVRAEGIVRAFAIAQAGADELRRARQGHVAWARALAQATQADHTAIAGDDWLDVNDALCAALDAGDAATGLALTMALRSAWMSRGAPRGSVAALGRLIDGLPADDPQRAALLCLLARLRMRVGETEAARQAAKAAVQASAGRGDALADALHALTSIDLLTGGANRRLLLSARKAEAAAAAGPAGLRARTAVLTASILSQLASGSQGDALLAEAEAKLQQAARWFDEAGDERGVLSVLPAHIACLLRRGKHAQVVEHAQAAVAQAERLGQVESELMLRNRLVLGLEGLRRWSQALNVNSDLLSRAHRHGMRYHMALALWNQIEQRLRLRRYEEAALTMGFAVDFWVANLGPLTTEDAGFVATLRERLEAAMGHLPLRAALRKGQGLALAQMLQPGRLRFDT